MLILKFEGKNGCVIDLMRALNSCGLGSDHRRRKTTPTWNILGENYRGSVLSVNLFVLLKKCITVNPLYNDDVCSKLSLTLK